MKKKASEQLVKTEFTTEDIALMLKKSLDEISRCMRAGSASTFAAGVREPEPLEMIAIQLIELNETLSRIADRLCDDDE